MCVATSLHNPTAVLPFFLPAWLQSHSDPARQLWMLGLSEAV